MVGPEEYAECLLPQARIGFMKPSPPQAGFTCASHNRIDLLPIVLPGPYRGGQYE